MIDLHIHSNYSDGKYSVGYIVELCNKSGIDVISICDHNTIDGLRDLENEKIRFINGVEFYAQRENTKQFHILGYDFDKNNPKLLSLLKDLECKRIECMKEKLKYIKERFYIDLDIETFSKSRMNDYDIFLNLNDIEDVRKVKEIMEYVKSLRLKPDRKVNPRIIIDTIRSAGGIPVLAHPRKIKCDDLDSLIKENVELGIMGIEVFHSCHTKEDTERFARIAKRYDLLTSGGSDYHGHYVKDIFGNDVEIGHFNMGEMVSEDQVSILKKVRK